MQLIHFSDYGIYNLFFYYIVYSFLGWCAEVGYAFKNQKKFVNRGFLHGPLCPIYGACILSVILLLNEFKYSNIFLLLLFATFFTSLIEYLTGFLLEKLFKTKYWDYTEDPFNLHGRICLHFSLMWGAVTIGIVKVIHPIVVNIINLIPDILKPALFFTLILFVIADFYSTLKSLINFRKIVFIFQPNGLLGNKYYSFIQNSNFETRINEIKEKLFKWKNKRY
ncbi:putative ABC transporter permease [Clostridium sp. SHJSY1]|uniref:putative ABC transporter permease n=1 Tax=Clostridium sp. SHJSY1 TaxID=2942483 RepID=UPI00287404B5|nr:putative ABC transporter permease [Clostridium sp. SHJSY1]MDS0524731.1 putative ABC transporter permease [Clostridium sp. SHJSY1]